VSIMISFQADLFRAVVSSVAHACLLLFDCIYRDCNIFHFPEDDRLGQKLRRNLLENTMVDESKSLNNK